MILLSSVVFVPNVKASTYDTGFEGGTVTQQFSNSWFSTYNVSGVFYVDSNNVRTGTRDFKVSGDSGDDGFWNYTYSEGSVMTSWNVWFYPQDDHAGVMFTFGTGTDIIIVMYVSSQKVAYYDHENTEHIMNATHPDAYNYFGWEMLGNDSVNYYYCDSVGAWSNASDTPRNILDEPVVAVVSLGGDQIGENKFVWFDDHEITISLEFEGEGEAGEGFDTTGLFKIGDIYADALKRIDLPETSCPFEASTYRFFETQRKVDCNYRIRHFCLAMSSDWIDTFSITELSLQVNGEYIGQPSGAIEIASDRYNIYWENVNVSINDYPLFEIRNLADVYHRWDAFFSESDIDGDGDIKFMAHDYEPYFDGKYIKEYGVGCLCDYDLVHEFWYEYGTPPVYEEYGYNLTVSPNTVDLYKPVTITYTCPVDVINNLVINNGVTDVYNETTGLTGLQTGIYIYNPLTNGTHNISIWDDTNGETELYEEITVNDVSYTYLIFSQPNPSKPNEYFDIYYIYNSSTYDGVIIIDDEEYIVLKNTSSLSVIENIIINIEGCYPIILYMNVSGGLIQKASSLHTVQIDTINELYIRYRCWDCSISTTYYDGDTILIISNQEFTFYGSHNFICKNVYINVFGTNMYVGYGSEFGERMTIQPNGDYVAELILEHEGVKLVLTDIHFTIVDEIEIIVEPSIWGIPEDYMNAMFGAFFTLGFLIIPFALSKGKASNVIYAIFGGLGLGISTIMGLFPLWLPFMITLVVLAIIIVEYKKG